MNPSLIYIGGSARARPVVKYLLSEAFALGNVCGDVEARVCPITRLRADGFGPEGLASGLSQATGLRFREPDDNPPASDCLGQLTRASSAGGYLGGQRRERPHGFHVERFRAANVPEHRLRWLPVSLDPTTE